MSICWTSNFLVGAIANIAQIVSSRTTGENVLTKSYLGLWEHPLATNLALYFNRFPFLSRFFTKMNLFAIGTTPGSFSTNFQVPISLSWSSSAWMAFSHSGHSSEPFAFFKFQQSSSGRTANTSSFSIVAMPASSSSGKGSFRYL